ncbi:MAG TPA: CotH kinase family protein, partial [Candidatus Faecivivens stercorigallinarum]|nr:CotH kinase family protein [Candidatus Faecivivens stercorigallinarum]
GELYKPDSVSIGGGRGNGQNFDMEKMFAEDGQETESAPSEQRENWSDTNNDVFPQLEDLSSEDILNALESAGLDVSIPDTVDQTDVQQVMEAILEKSDMREVLDALRQNGSEDSQTRMGKGGGGGMSSEDTLLQYIDDDPDSYSNIFSSAKTDITDADKQRLITSLKTLSGIVDGTVDAVEAAEVVDIESVIRYFVVHNFVCNGDSYTGSIVHNYYLYEENGVMEMIPWDYNLAFGGFSGGGMGSSLTSEVNSPIDTPVSSGDISERPMVAWIFSSEEYADLYHQIYAEFIEKWFDSGYFEQLFDQTVSMISAYVEKDPTAFCSYNEFEEGVSTLRQFCLLRAQSVSGQLDGTIPSTQDGQNADSSMLIDASSLDAEAMGGQSMGGMPGGGGGMMSENGQKMPLNSESFGQMSDGSTPSSEESADGASSTGFDGEVADRPADPSDGAEGPSDMKAPIGSEDTGGAVSTDLDENSVPGQMESITLEESPSSDDNVQPEQQSEEAFDQSFTPPDSGGFPERMDMPTDGGMQPGNGIPGQSAGNTVQWIWILLCAGVLLAGIAVVKVYRHW